MYVRDIEKKKELVKKFKEIQGRKYLFKKKFYKSAKEIERTSWG